jgi:hypothetical protein
MGHKATLAISGQSDVRWKLSGWECNVYRPHLRIKSQIRWHFIGGINIYRSDDVTGSTVGLYTDLTHQGHIGRWAILAISGQSDGKWKISGLKCPVSRSQPCINCQIRWHSIRSKKSYRSDDVNVSTVGLYTDLTHQGRIGRSAILAIPGQSDVEWKLSGWKCHVNRPQLFVNCEIECHSLGGMSKYRPDDVIGSTVGLFTDLTHQGHIGRSAIIGISGQSDVEWKPTGLKCTVRRSLLCINCQIRWLSIESMIS